MLQVAKVDELAIRVPDAGRATSLLSEIIQAGVDVFAYCFYPTPGGALSLVVTNQSQQAQAILREGGVESKTSPIVLVRTPPRPAIAAQLGIRLTAARIGICYCYTTWHEPLQLHIVFKTTDDDRAIRVLQADALRQLSPASGSPSQPTANDSPTAPDPVENLLP